MFQRKPESERIEEDSNEENEDEKEYEDAEYYDNEEEKNTEQTIDSKIDIEPIYKNIIHHFDNFQNFDYLTSVFKTGLQSANGTAYNLNFIKNGKSASALIKTANKSHSDNLYYEYLVGTLFINKMCKIVPCFIQTHHILLKEDKYVLNKVNIRDKMTYLTGLYGGLLDDKQMDYLETSCKKSAQIALMMQYIKNYETFFEYIDRNLPYFKVIESLFQIYYPLYYLQRNFTHYDLHAGNVLMSKLPEKTYIKMTYFMMGKKKVEFKTNRIAKIIDYGRSFFHVNGVVNSDKIAKRVLDADDCKNTIRDPFGFGYNFIKCKDEISDYYICSRRSNMSHDLKLVAQYKNVNESNKTLVDIAEMIVYDGRHGTKEIYDKFIYDEKKSHNIKERVDRLLLAYQKQMIYNVEGLAFYLLHQIKENTFKRDIDNYYNDMTCIGQLNVYLDGSKKNMEFLAANTPMNS
jgi:hypothetical protein